MSKPVDLFSEAILMEHLDRLDDPRVQLAATLVEEPAIRHLMSQRVLERVLDVGEEARLVQEFRGLQVREGTAHRLLVSVSDALEEHQRDVLADDRGGLEKPLVLQR